MTLEKLLIFSFSIAVTTALVVVGSNQMSDRAAAKDTYTSKVSSLVSAANP
jgi:multisubunit Na+/H+ antiporter MnhF subunit